MTFEQKKTAYWIQKTHLLRADEYICSACGRRFDQPHIQCPHCGRHMTKSRYDPTWVDEAEMLDILG
jgi:rRNA maturation endonuclease Nob1